MMTVLFAIILGLFAGAIGITMVAVSTNDETLEITAVVLLCVTFVLCVMYIGLLRMIDEGWTIHWRWSKHTDESTPNINVMFKSDANRVYRNGYYCKDSPGHVVVKRDEP